GASSWQINTVRIDLPPTRLDYSVRAKTPRGPAENHTPAAAQRIRLVPRINPSGRLRHRQCTGGEPPARGAEITDDASRQAKLNPSSSRDGRSVTLCTSCALLLRNARVKPP